MIDQSAPGDVIRLDGVTKTYQAGGQPALAEVSMGVAAGEVVAVIDGCADVATAGVVYRVARVHPPGRRPMDAAAYLRGRR